MSGERAAVRNAADTRQVGNASRRAADAERMKRDRLIAVLKTPEGRAVLWDMLVDCRVFESIWHGSALIHYNAGVQDTGHKLLARIIDASEDLYQQMEREARERKRRGDVATEAAHIASANEGE